jgi:hypothetical protein
MYLADVNGKEGPIDDFKVDHIPQKKKDGVIEDPQKI